MNAYFRDAYPRGFEGCPIPTESSLDVEVHRNEESIWHEMNDINVSVEIEDNGALEVDMTGNKYVIFRSRRIFYS